MPHMHENPGRFASAFSELLARSGMSLADVVARLERQGLATTQASLSYWRTGRSLPRRAASRPIVEALDDMLAGGSRALVQALLADLSRSPSSRNLDPVPHQAENPVYIDKEDISYFSAFDEAIDWNHEVHRETLDVTATLSADLRRVTRTVTSLVRIPPSPNPTLHVGVGLDSNDTVPDEGYVPLLDVEGALIDEVKTYRASRSTITRLSLPPHLHPGELCRVSYTYILDTVEPVTAAGTQTISWPLRFYCGRLIFEGEIPDDIRWVQMQTTQQGDETTRIITSLSVEPFGNAIQISRDSLVPSQTHFEWS